MSDVKRFNTVFGDGSGRIAGSHIGQYVLHSDYESLQSQLALHQRAIDLKNEQLDAANERADGLQLIVDKMRVQVAALAFAVGRVKVILASIRSLHGGDDEPEQPWARAAEAEVIIDNAIEDSTVPAQPAVVPTYEIVMSSGRKARLTATELVDRLATCRDEIERLRGERRVQPAVVPKHAADRIHEMRDVLFDIATSDVMGDRPEHSFVTVAINRDTLSRAAILSTTDTEVKNG